MTSEEHSGAGRGTLLLADISGYTASSKRSRGAHAAEMAAGRFVPKPCPLLTSLLDGIVGRIAPPFALSKLEGDAVFAFVGEGQLGVRGQSVVDCLTACYGAYRGRLTRLARSWPAPAISHLLLKDHVADFPWSARSRSPSSTSICTCPGARPDAP